MQGASPLLVLSFRLTLPTGTQLCPPLSLPSIILRCPCPAAADCYGTSCHVCAGLQRHPILFHFMHDSENDRSRALSCSHVSLHVCTLILIDAMSARQLQPCRLGVCPLLVDLARRLQCGGTTAGWRCPIVAERQWLQHHKKPRARHKGTVPPPPPAKTGCTRGQQRSRGGRRKMVREK